MARKLKIMENEKHPLEDLKNDEITKKREKNEFMKFLAKWMDLEGIILSEVVSSSYNKCIANQNRL